MTADEIEIFRDHRPDAAPYDPASKARARARLLDGARPRRRPRWTFAVSAAAAGVLAAGLFLLPGDDPARTGPSMRPVSAAVYLEQAAQVVERRADVRPRPRQWLYEKKHLKSSDGSTDRSVETWKRLDGQKAASGRGPDGKPDIDGPYLGRNERSLLRKYDDLRRLPADPKRLLSRAYKTVDDRFAKRRAQIKTLPSPYKEVEEEDFALDTTADSRHQAAFRELAGFFEGVLTPPRLHAAAFRAIAEVPGVEVLSDSTDPSGGPVVSIARMDQYGTRIEYMIDPVTYAGRGLAAVVVRNDLMRRPGSVGRGEDGLLTREPPQIRPVGDAFYEFREMAGIVDEAGRLPR